MVEKKKARQGLAEPHKVPLDGNSDVWCLPPLYSEYIARQLLKLIGVVALGGVNAPIARRPALGTSSQPGDMGLTLELNGRVLA